MPKKITPLVPITILLDPKTHHTITHLASRSRMRKNTWLKMVLLIRLREIIKAQTDALKAYQDLQSNPETEQHANLQDSAQC